MKGLNDGDLLFLKVAWLDLPLFFFFKDILRQKSYKNEFKWLVITLNVARVNLLRDLGNNNKIHPDVLV